MRINSKTLSQALTVAAVVFMLYTHTATTRLLDNAADADGIRPPVSTNALLDKSETPIIDYRLEFLHIPKTGGTLIEVIAKEHGVPWGACKFLPPWRNRPKSKSPLKDCPKMIKPQYRTEEALWHFPIPVLYERYPSFLIDDPYDNTPLKLQVPEQKEFFAVIRNPYSWFISLYTMCPPCYRSESLSDYVSAWFTKRGRVNYCQHEFLYNISSPPFLDKNGHILQYSQRIVKPDLVLRMESLKEELEALWARHGYSDWKVPSRDERAINQRKTKQLISVENFTEAALNLIHYHCRLDFQEGSYEMVELSEWRDTHS